MSVRRCLSFADGWKYECGSIGKSGWGIGGWIDVWLVVGKDFFYPVSGGSYLCSTGSVEYKVWVNKKIKTLTRAKFIKLGNRSLCR